MMYAKRTDANHAEIRDAMREAGATVEDLSGSGRGVPDTLVRTTDDRLLLVEIKTLTGKRLVFSFGLFWGVDVPEELTEEDLEDEPFVELLFRFSKGSGYSYLKLEAKQFKPYVPGEVVKLATRAA